MRISNGASEQIGHLLLVGHQGQTLKLNGSIKLHPNTNEYKAITAAQAAAQAEFNSTALAAALAVALNSVHSNLQLRLNFEAGPARAPLPHHAAPPKKKAFTLS